MVAIVSVKTYDMQCYICANVVSYIIVKVTRIFEMFVSDQQNSVVVLD